MKKKKKISCCVNAGCFSGGRGSRNDWSSELDYEKDYEKYGREYEREYARLCELQRSLTPAERSTRSEATTSTFEQSTFSRRYSSFDTLEITDEGLEQDLKKMSHQIVAEDSDYDVDLLEKLINEAEEDEMLDRRRKQEEQEEKQRRKNAEMAQRKRDEEEIERRRKEELERIAREEEEIARKRRDEIARRQREEEENARRRRDELARKKREEEMAWRKKQEEEIGRKQREQLARRKWEEEENERRKREEEENGRRQREQLAKRKWEEEENERRKREEEENGRRHREQLAKRKWEEGEIEQRKRGEEENVRRQREQLARRKWEEENERRKRAEEEMVRRQREELARRKREEEETERRKREEETVRRQKEELARRKWEEEENARRKREELSRRVREEDEIARRRREEQARREREEEENGRRRREELTGQKKVEDKIARRQEDEEEEAEMEGWQMQQDLSWMSLTHQARNRATGVSMNGDRIDRIRRTDSERYDASPSVGGRSTWNETGDASRRSMSFSGGWHNEWREVEFLEEEQEEEVKLIRNRTRRGKEVARDDFDDGASSSASELGVEWESGRPADNPFSPLHLGAGFQRKFQRRREELLSRFEQKLLAAARIPKSKLHSRLQNASRVIIGVLGIVLLFILFLLHLSFVARVRPPGECVDDRIILNFSATRIRLRGGRYVSFREEGVGANRAEHSVVVVHDLLSSRLAGIPGINASLLEEYKVRLISYDRPGYGQSDPHLGRNYNTSAYDIVEIADALNLGEKFWVVGFGGGGPHVWAAIKYLPQRLAGVALFAPAGNPYVSSMSKDEIDETWGVLTLRQKWMYSIARRFPALLPRLLQRTAVTNSPYVPRNVRLSLGQKDQKWMEQPHVIKAWQEDVKEALRHGCAFPVAEELMLLVNDWGFSLSELPFKEQTANTVFRHVASLFGGEKKPKIYNGSIHIWQGTDDQLVPVTINNVAKRLVEANDLLESETKSPPVKLHYLPGEGHFSWFWFCDECHRRIFQTLFRPTDTSETEEDLPFSSKGFSKDDYEAIVKAFAALKMTPDPYSAEGGRGSGGKALDNSATTRAREEELKKVLRNVLRNRKSEEAYTRREKVQVVQESEKGAEEGDTKEVHPLTCRATNEALKDKSVLYVCPEDDDMPDETDFTPRDTRSSMMDRATESKTVRKRDNSKDTKNRTSNISTYLEGLSTLVKRLARNRK